jgi:hypothetical protein
VCGQIRSDGNFSKGEKRNHPSFDAGNRQQEIEEQREQSRHGMRPGFPRNLLGTSLSVFVTAPGGTRTSEKGKEKKIGYCVVCMDGWMHVCMTGVDESLGLDILI